MTTTSPISASTPATAPSIASASKTLGTNYTDFLKLLMTQLKNQDPTAPLDTNQFTSQLVQFSSVEQQINSNKSLTTLIGLQQGNQVLQSSALIGKTVDVSSTQIDLQKGSGALNFTTASPGSAVVTVTSASGQTIRSDTVQTVTGKNSWHWNGLDDSGDAMPDGAYTVGVASSGGKETTSTSLPFTVSGVATGVKNTTGGMSLQVGALQVPLTAVQSIQ